MFLPDEVEKGLSTWGVSQSLPGATTDLVFKPQLQCILVADAVIRRAANKSRHYSRGAVLVPQIVSNTRAEARTQKPTHGNDGIRLRVLPGIQGPAHGASSHAFPLGPNFTAY